MNQKLLRTVSVCALVAAFSGAAVAQTGGAGGGGSAPGGSAPQTQQKMPDSGAGDAGRSTQSPQRSETGQPKGETKQPGSAQRSDDRATPRKQDRSDTKSDQRRTPQASDSQRKDDGKRATDRGRDRDKDRTRTGQEQRGQDKDRARTGQEQRSKDKDRTRTGQDQRDRGDRTRQGQTDRGQDAERGTRLSEQQRTNARERFTRSGIERNRVTNVNFDIRVGASVPRSVTLHTLPAGVVEVVPQYRSYRYVYVNDDIVIVDPGTYAVVAVISSGGGRAAGPRGSRLTLAAPARTYLRDHIDRGASIRLGIGAISIGMDVPQGVSLLPVPTVVVDRYPELEDYRYFVYEDDIAIVDPTTDEVVLIVED